MPHRGDIIQARTGGRTDLRAVVSNDIRNADLDSLLDLSGRSLRQQRL